MAADKLNGFWHSDHSHLVSRTGSLRRRHCQARVSICRFARRAASCTQARTHRTSGRSNQKFQRRMQACGYRHQIVLHCWRVSRTPILLVICRGHGSRTRWRAATFCRSSAFRLFSIGSIARTLRRQCLPAQPFCSIRKASLRVFLALVGRRSLGRGERAQWRMAEARSSLVLAHAHHGS